MESERGHHRQPAKAVGPGRARWGREPGGETARAKLAQRSREKISRSSGTDMSQLSDSETLDHYMAR